MASTRVSRVWWLALASVLFLTGATQARQAEPAATPQVQPPAGGRGRMGMMVERDAARQKLDDLVAKMNAATGQAKVDMMAAVLTELVAQHNGMGRMMAPPASPAATPPDEKTHHE